MSGEGPNLVRNTAGCSCTNSIHAVRFIDGDSLASIEEVWNHPFVRLSCEIEGHPLGGGMLKLEPGESPHRFAAKRHAVFLARTAIGRRRDRDNAELAAL